MLQWSYRSEIWQAPRQQRCQGTCQISEQLEKFKPESRGFETSQDLAVRRLTALWIEALVMLARNHIGMKFSSWNISISVPEWSNCFFNMRTSMRFCPTGTWRNDNVITTSKRSRFDVIMTLFLCCVSTGCVHSATPLHGYCLVVSCIWQLCIQCEMVVNGPCNNSGVRFWEIVGIILDCLFLYW